VATGHGNVHGTVVMNYSFPLMNQQNKLKIFPRFQEFTHDIAKI